MNFIEPMNLGPAACQLSYRNETKNEHWLALHAHQGLELLLIHQGQGSVSIERNVYPLQSGMLFCFQPYQLHKVEVPVQGDHSYIRTNLTFDPRITEPYTASFPKLQSFIRHLSRGTLTQQVFNLNGDTRMEELLSSFHHARQNVAEPFQDEERALFLLALLHHLQLHVFPSNGPQLNPDSMENGSLHIENILDWLEAHYTSPFKLETMARELHLSTYYVSHLFKRQVGMTLSDYISDRRLREACMLLANTNKSVSEIGRQIGSFSAPYFCQLFKKHKGVSPQTYRSAIRRALE